jgi:hypothetical protein
MGFQQLWGWVHSAPPCRGRVPGRDTRLLLTMPDYQNTPPSARARRISANGSSASWGSPTRRPSRKSPRSSRRMRRGKRPSTWSERGRCGRRKKLRRARRGRRGRGRRCCTGGRGEWWRGAVSVKGWARDGADDAGTRLWRGRRIRRTNPRHEWVGREVGVEVLEGCRWAQDWCTCSVARRSCCFGQAEATGVALGRLCVLCASWQYTPRGSRIFWVVSGGRPGPSWSVWTVSATRVYPCCTSTSTAS